MDRIPKKTTRERYEELCTDYKAIFQKECVEQQDQTFRCDLLRTLFEECEKYKQKKLDKIR